MDASTIISTISNVGFPIACCVMMFYQMVKQSEQHKEEMSKVIEALNNNTLALNRLELKIGDCTHGWTE